MNIEKRSNWSTFPFDPISRLFDEAAAKLPEAERPQPTTEEIVEKCLLCDGRGYDMDDNWNKVECEDCGGTGKITVEHNWLQEAFRIAQGRFYGDIRREHVIASIGITRQVVSTLLGMKPIINQIESLDTEETLAASLAIANCRKEKARDRHNGVGPADCTR